MVDCVDILRSITKSCGDNVGGVNKRVWITQLQQIENYTFDSLGYVNSLVTKENGNTNYPYELKKVISKKGSHSGNVEAIENVNIDVFKHTAILKAYATTPEQRDSLVSLYGASKVVVFFETDNGDIEIYGLENGLYATALTGNTGEQMQDDTAFTFTLSGLQTSLPKYFLYGGSLHTSIAYLDNIGLTPIYEIESYTAGTSTIDFTNNGGDDWDISFLATPTTVQSSANITGYQYSVEHWISGVQTNIESGSKSTNYTLNTSSNGAGVYKIEQTYLLDNSSFFRVVYLVKVDASGTVIAFTSANGITVNSTNGLDINATANYTEFGVNYPLQWGSYDAFPPAIFNPIGNTTTINATLPIATVGVGFFPILDSIFTDDFPNWAGSAITLTIS